MNVQSFTKSAVFIVGFVCIFSLIWTHRHYFPLWDGFIYAQCFSDVFSLKSFSCANHISLGATLPMGFAMFLAHKNVFSIIASNFILLLIATWCYWKIINIIFHDNKSTIESSLATLLFLFQPVVVANVIQPGLDLPLFTYYILSIYFFLQKRFLLGCITGIFLVLTKEPGVGLWIALCVSYGYFFWEKKIPFETAQKTRLLRANDSLFYFILPLLIFIAVMLYRAHFKEPAFWSDSDWKVLISHPDIYLINYLCLIFFINFSWIQTVFITLGLLNKNTAYPFKSNHWHF